MGTTRLFVLPKNGRGMRMSATSMISTRYMFSTSRRGTRLSWNTPNAPSIQGTAMCSDISG